MADLRLVFLTRLALSLLALALTGGIARPAKADEVPFACTILPGEELASIVMTNPLAGDASCIVTCKFATTKYDNNPQITCAKAVPSGKEVEMCRLTSGGDKFVKLTEGRADCLRLSAPIVE
ncbi:MAG: hypothetical protein ACRED3_11365 [Bradyrhizobium sp.]